MTKRDISSGFETAALAPILRPCFLFEGDFIGGFVRVWDGVGPLAWGDLVFDGVGTLGMISSSEETDELKSSPMIVSLSGVPPAQIGFALAEVAKSRFRRATVYIGAIDDAGQLVDDPYQWFSGRIDECDIEDGGADATIKITINHELVDLERPVTIRYDDAQQQRDFPGDLGLQYMVGLQNKTLKWGETP